MKYGRLTARDAAARGYLPGQVRLGGVVYRRVCDFDDVEGWIDCQVCDVEGHPVVPPGSNIVGIARLHGEVEYFPNTHTEDGVLIVIGGHSDYSPHDDRSYDPRVEMASRDRSRLMQLIDFYGVSLIKAAVACVAAERTDAPEWKPNLDNV